MRPFTNRSLKLQKYHTHISSLDMCLLDRKSANEKFMTLPISARITAKVVYYICECTIFGTQWFISGQYFTSNTTRVAVVARHNIGLNKGRLFLKDS